MSINMSSFFLKIYILVRQIILDIRHIYDIIYSLEIEMKEYPIRIVSKITGLTSDQIRKWEERYPILKISRSERGSRRFTDKDLEITCNLCLKQKG